jgi:cyclopropane-fatty-acyl-phospholipid synthase
MSFGRRIEDGDAPVDDASSASGGEWPLGLSPWLRLLVAVAGRIREGELVLGLPDGHGRTFRGQGPGPSGTLIVRRERAGRRLAIGGSLGFAEAYLDGDWDSTDLPRLLELLAVNDRAWEELHGGRLWYRGLQRLRHLARPNSRRGSRRNIAAHYDLGNEFYARWLDPTMTYSAAAFERHDEPLESAQIRKYARLAERMALAPGQHVLEIGCGWGGFAVFAAGEVGARVTAITISEEQHAFAARRLQREGLGERVELRLQDYRDVEGSFDAIASIEMLEAVGERYWPVFFDKLRQTLAPGGRVGLQAITIADRYFEAYRKGVDFIQRHVFPGGMLPSPTVLGRQIEQAGLRLLEQASLADSYAATLASWQTRFQAAWPEIRAQGYDDRFKRIWEYYLAYCEAGFRSRSTDVVQLALARA